MTSSPMYIFQLWSVEMLYAFCTSWLVFELWYIVECGFCYIYKFLMSSRKQDRHMKGMDKYCTKNTCTTLLKHNARGFQIQVNWLPNNFKLFAIYVDVCWSVWLAQWYGNWLVMQGSQVRFPVQHIGAPKLF